MKRRLLFMMLPVIVILDVDLIIFLSKSYLDQSDWRFLFSISILATLELIYLFCLIKELTISLIHIRQIQEDIEFSKEIGDELKRSGLLNKLKWHFADKYHWILNHKGRFMKWARRGSYAAVFLLSASPEFGGRLTAVTICSVADSKKMLIMAIIGNIVHIMSLTWVVGLIWNLVQKIY